MPNPQLDTKHKTTAQVHTETKKDSSLKGTLISVFLIGGFIVVSWVSAFFLFLSRN